jgi:uncharacterized protein YdeI (YjbR/CyaY-like superfamily)
VKNPEMNDNTLYVKTRQAWREWLEQNYKTATEIWLVYPRKQSGEPRIPYNDAVEEALCFGWIDSITKTIDSDRYAQRFSVRKQRSKYSQTNKERLRRLLAEGKVVKAVQDEVQGIVAEEYEFPADIEAALRANKKAWENFQNYSGAYQRIRVAYVDSARKRPEEFEKRLKNLIQKTEQDKQFGFGIEAYY